MRSDISSLLDSVQEATEADRKNYLDQAYKFEDRIWLLQSAIVTAEDFIYGKDGFDSQFFVRNVGPAFDTLQQCCQTVRNAKSILGDLAGVEELLTKVVSAPRDAAKDILNRLTERMNILPELTDNVTKAGQDALDAWFSLMTTAEKSKARADIKSGQDHTPTKPTTILTATAGGYNV